ncbi:MAG: hypothetical protein C4529_07065 [Deltaproteobacteria bacterium]|nr:MAG: hypothetical protein C4529_07065 [Deltaproteobacteria bacterium]
MTTSAAISTGTALKSILQLVAPAGVALVAKRASISFDGNSPTANKILVQIFRSMTGGTFTARTPAKINASDAESLAATGGENATVEPSGGTVVFEELVHPQGGYTAPEEIKIKAGETLTIRTTAPAAVNCRARIIFEE